jgi:aspartate/methionine/tyrosine aminotransferase
MLDPEDLDRSCGAAKRPRLLFLNSPSNPTGLSYTPDELTVLAAVCRRHGVVVLSDEIYGDLAFSGDHRSIARAYPEGTIVASGLSKWCGAGGWRLGTLGLPPTLRPLRRALEAVASETFTSTSAPIQHAAVAAFRPSAEIEHYLEVARRVLSIATTWAASRLRLCDVDVQEPAGGFYLYVGFASKRTELARAGIEDDRALLERALTDTGVVSVAGSAFGSDPRDLYLRLALVDFDGARALRRAASSVLDVEFLQQVLRPLWDGINALAEWIDRGFRRPS